MSDGSIRVRSEDGHERAIVFDLFEERRLQGDGVETVRFDRLMADGDLEPGVHVSVQPPKWRGYSFAELLEWIVCARLSRPGETKVSWRAAKKGGATGVRRILAARGWATTESKSGPHFVFEGVAPYPGPQPRPRSFRAELGGTDLVFAADWGVFSKNHVDEGTKMLFDSAVEEIGGRPLARATDVGTGYGAVAVGLLAAGLCRRCVGSEIDFVATHLARQNASTAGVNLSVVAEDDPARLPDTELTVCEMPTHASAEVTQVIVAGLAERSARGPVLVVVHRRLASRYAKLLRRAGPEPEIVEGETHVLLRLAPTD